MTDSPDFTDEESRWQAIAQRDRSADTIFYYGVNTTGVYCRPGCSSRHPIREHVEFFSSIEQAERAGYRPCKRCRPHEVSPRIRLVELIVKACRRLDQEQPPPLAQLAAEAGLSPNYFQRRFKEMVGVTPKQYALSRQAQRFRDRLTTEGSVTEAIYGAGYGSSSRAYDNARRHLAMSPTSYRNGATGLTINFAVAPCFLGWVLAATTDRGICAIEFDDDRHHLISQLRTRFPQAHLEAAGPEFSAVMETVVAFIDRPRKGLDLPLDIQGTAFQQQIWQALREIPPGSSMSYSELARQVGKPKAVRAVARACAANKIAVAIPCHRVVRNDGTSGGYRWGVSRKQALLQRESDEDAVLRDPEKQGSSEGGT